MVTSERQNCGIKQRRQAEEQLSILTTVLLSHADYRSALFSLSMDAMKFSWEECGLSNMYNTQYTYEELIKRIES